MAAAAAAVSESQAAMTALQNDSSYMSAMNSRLVDFMRASTSAQTERLRIHCQASIKT